MCQFEFLFIVCFYFLDLSIEEAHAFLRAINVWMCRWNASVCMYVIAIAGS